MDAEIAFKRRESGRLNGPEMFVGKPRPLAKEDLDFAPAEAKINDGVA